MNNSDHEELLKKCQEFNAYLKQNANIQEFNRLKEKLGTPEYLELEERIKELQQEIVNANYAGEEIDSLKEELDQLHDQYFNSPLVNNYSYLLEEINLLYQYINDYINGSIQL